LAIYKAVYSALKEIEPAALPGKVAQELRRFDSPDLIKPAKAVAILKAMMGSTRDDKFSLEGCYSVQMPGGEQSLSGFVQHEVRKHGISYVDFGPYLTERGWVRSGSDADPELT
jgi:hypothetical protein